MAAGTLLAGISLALGAIKAYDNGEDMKKHLNDNKNKINVALSGGSMIKFLNKFIVEPTAIISDSLKNEEVTEKVLELEADMFASFYMQVFDIMTNLHGLEGTMAIDLLSTNNSIFKAANSYVLNHEDIEIDYVGELFKSDKLPTLSTEAKDRTGRSTSVVDNDLYKTIPGAIQRELNLTLRVVKDGNSYTITVPVLIKLNVVYTPISNIMTVLDTHSKDNDFWERVDEYRAGSITLTDLLFASDLIKKYKKNKLKDKDSLLEIIDSKRSSSNITAATSGAAGFERYYNMLIISEEDKILIEKALRGKLNKDKYKEDLLERFSSLMVTVIDRDYERVAIFIKDLHGYTDVSYKSLTKRKASTNDYSEIFKALLSGRPPVI